MGHDARCLGRLPGPGRRSRPRARRLGSRAGGDTDLSQARCRGSGGRPPLRSRRAAQHARGRGGRRGHRLRERGDHLRRRGQHHGHRPGGHRPAQHGLAQRNAGPRRADLLRLDLPVDVHRSRRAQLGRPGHPLEPRRISRDREPRPEPDCRRPLSRLHPRPRRLDGGGGQASGRMSLCVLTVALKFEDDVVLARQRARQIARLMGFEAQDQTRIATAVSEIARNAFRYAGSGKVEFGVEGRTAPQLFEIVVSDQGPGIARLSEILEGRYRSSTGMGLGIMGARRLMDQFEIASTPGQGTRIVLGKLLPPGSPVLDPARVAVLGDELAREVPRGPMEEIQRQNQELITALEELRRRQDELEYLNRELEDTNRGVVALYAELDEKADHLRRADELKSRFLSNMSHEFRTPLNSIMALSHLLLDRADGPLTPEQAKQVTFIRQGANALTELVNDLLDLAKVEAGKIIVRPVEFEVENMFGALRGMLRPLLVNESLALVFEPADGMAPLYTDEGKVSQILRNFISNALKYTERGEVRVRAIHDPETDTVSFEVIDTGIGIAPEEQERIFEEFVQVENPLQHRIKGTGLGLPLSRRLAELLGGRVTVRSTIGEGSIFSAVIPCTYVPRTTTAMEEETTVTAERPGRDAPF